MISNLSNLYIPGSVGAFRIIDYDDNITALATSEPDREGDFEDDLVPLGVSIASADNPNFKRLILNLELVRYSKEQIKASLGAAIGRESADSEFKVNRDEIFRVSPRYAPEIVSNIVMPVVLGHINKSRLASHLQVDQGLVFRVAREWASLYRK